MERRWKGRPLLICHCARPGPFRARRAHAHDAEARRAHGGAGPRLHRSRGDDPRRLRGLGYDVARSDAPRPPLNRLRERSRGAREGAAPPAGREATARRVHRRHTGESRAVTWIVFRSRKHAAMLCLRAMGPAGWVGPTILAVSLASARRLTPVGELLWRLPRRAR